MEYTEFLAAKAVKVPDRGVDEMPVLSSAMKAHQRNALEFALRKGSCGLFLDTGLGKTLVELEFCRVASEVTEKPSLILAPLAVAGQIAREAERFDIDARVIRSGDEAKPGVNIINYDRLHLIDPAAFGGVSLDESGILKSFSGKTTRALIEAFASTRFRMAATATPAPNDHMELGQHSDFLGIMPANEMLMRWFINDTSTASQQWRLKGHATADFWDWMSSWARMAELPSDLGGDDAGYNLPPLNVHRHRVNATVVNDGEGLFGGDAQMSATNIHNVKRQTAGERAARAAELASSDSEPWVLWVDTDYEADAVRALLPDAIEVRGSQPVETKERNLARFLDGSARVLITKPSVCGFGLNWQHCARTTFVGRSFSYEAWYQAVRRFWRFGQARPVECHIIVAEGEDAIGRVIDRKSADHARMKSAMRAAMARSREQGRAERIPYNPTHAGRLPKWLSAA